MKKAANAVFDNLGAKEDLNMKGKPLTVEEIKGMKMNSCIHTQLHVFY